jgi:hypothetical protein
LPSTLFLTIDSSSDYKLATTNNQKNSQDIKPIVLKSLHNSIYAYAGQVWTRLALRGYVMESDMKALYGLSHSGCNEIMTYLELCLKSSGKHQKDSIRCNPQDGADSGSIFYLPLKGNFSDRQKYFVSPSGYGFRKSDNSEFRLGNSEFALLKYLELNEGSDVLLSSIFLSVYNIAKVSDPALEILNKDLEGLRDKFGLNAKLMPDVDIGRETYQSHFNIMIKNDYIVKP